VVPLKREVYPSCDAFGSLPAFAVFMRDAEDVQLTNLSLRTLVPDARPALRWQRVGRLRMQNVVALDGGPASRADNGPSCWT
jgi:hypothetical protein